MDLDAAAVLEGNSAQIPGILAGRRGNLQTDAVAAQFRTRGQHASRDCRSNHRTPSSGNVRLVLSSDRHCLSSGRYHPFFASFVANTIPANAGSCLAESTTPFLVGNDADSYGFRPVARPCFPARRQRLGAWAAPQYNGGGY